MRPGRASRKLTTRRREPWCGSGREEVEVEAGHVKQSRLGPGVAAGHETRGLGHGELGHVMLPHLRAGILGCAAIYDRTGHKSHLN